MIVFVVLVIWKFINFMSYVLIGGVMKLLYVVMVCRLVKMCWCMLVGVICMVQICVVVRKLVRLFCIVCVNSMFVVEFVQIDYSCDVVSVISVCRIIGLGLIWLVRCFYYGVVMSVVVIGVKYVVFVIYVNGMCGIGDSLCRNSGQNGFVIFIVFIERVWMMRSYWMVFCYVFIVVVGFMCELLQLVDWVMWCVCCWIGCVGVCG